MVVIGLTAHDVGNGNKLVTIDIYAFNGADKHEAMCKNVSACDSPEVGVEAARTAAAALNVQVMFVVDSAKGAAADFLEQWIARSDIAYNREREKMLAVESLVASSCPIEVQAKKALRQSRIQPLAANGRDRICSYVPNPNACGASAFVDFFLRHMEHFVEASSA